MPAAPIGAQQDGGGARAPPPSWRRDPDCPVPDRPVPDHPVPDHRDRSTRPTLLSHVGTESARFLFHRPMTRRPDRVRSAARGISAGVNFRGTRGIQSSTLGVAVRSRLDSGEPIIETGLVFTCLAAVTPLPRSLPKATIGPGLHENQRLAITRFTSCGCTIQSDDVASLLRQSTDHDVVTCVTAEIDHPEGLSVITGHPVSPLPNGPSGGLMRVLNTWQIGGVPPGGRSGWMSRRNLQRGHSCTVIAHTHCSHGPAPGATPSRTCSRYSPAGEFSIEDHARPYSRQEFPTPARLSRHA